MKILLIKDVQGLGRASEIKEVSDGYARNFLIPKGLGVIASEAVISKLSKEQAEKQERAGREHEKHLKLKTQVENMVFTIKAKANKETLFAAVHESEITKAINQKLGLDISSEQITITSPIKTLGKHQAEIKLEASLKALVNLSIEAV